MEIHFRVIYFLSLITSYSRSQETYNPRLQTWIVNFETVPCGESEKNLVY